MSSPLSPATTIKHIALPSAIIVPYALVEKNVTKVLTITSQFVRAGLQHLMCANKHEVAQPSGLNSATLLK